MNLFPAIQRPVHTKQESRGGKDCQPRFTDEEMETQKGYSSSKVPWLVSGKVEVSVQLQSLCSFYAVS